MQTALFLCQLALNLGDPSNQVYSANLNQAAMVLAVRSYSRWRPLLRTFGTGVLYSGASPGAMSIQVVGGTYVQGQQIQIVDMFSTETFTVQSMQAGSPLPNWMGVPIQLNLSGPLANSHAAGVFVGMSLPGLVIVPGQQYYALPLDFTVFDQLTWDLANGQRFAVKNDETYYGGVYYWSELLDGRGWGNTQTYASSSGGFGGFGGGGFTGIPNATGFVPPNVSGTSQTVLEVQPGSPPMLYMSPPQQSAQVWQFNYYAMHQPETVPDQDFDAVIDASRAIATEAQNQIKAGILDSHDVDQGMTPSANAKAFMDIAEMAFKQFDIKVRKRPVMITG